MARFGQLLVNSSYFDYSFDGSYNFVDENNRKNPLPLPCLVIQSEEQLFAEEECSQLNVHQLVSQRERIRSSLVGTFEKMKVVINFIFKSDIILTPDRDAELKTLPRAKSIVHLLFDHLSQDIPEAVVISASITLALVECDLVGAVGQRNNGRHGVIPPDSISACELIQRVIRRVNLLCDGKFGGIPNGMRRVEQHRDVLLTIIDISKISTNFRDDSGNKCEIQNKKFAEELQTQFEMFCTDMNNLINSGTLTSTLNTKQKSEEYGQKRIRYSEDPEELIDEQEDQHRSEKAKKMFLFATILENYGKDNRNKRLGMNIRRNQRQNMKQINKNQSSEKEEISQQGGDESFQSQVDNAIMQQEKEEEETEQLKFVHLRRKKIAIHFLSNTQTIREIEKIVLGERGTEQSEYLPWWCTIKVGKDSGKKEKSNQAFTQKDGEWGSDNSTDQESNIEHDLESEEEEGQFVMKPVKRKR
ncbi:MAG: hypothetical protein EZS28_011322 [Streblomastix strix]|uniref:Uncharacterized protein n=1 Tax=Streblomastix strix TaxID=222440 RepID=A0A5J4WEN2_9EUKA|nr:MAG: hypothetical protein EZS28_011322 [Streblomastix strix]